MENSRLIPEIAPLIPGSTLFHCCPGGQGEGPVIPTNPIQTSLAKLLHKPIYVGASLSLRQK